MSWILPVPLLLLAGVVALWPLAVLVRRPTSAPRLVAEAFVTALAVIALVWLAWGTLAARATLVSKSADRPILARDLAGTVAHAGVDPTLEGRALQDALRKAIATRRGYCSWTVDHASWVVTLHSHEEQDFYGKTLAEALAWCLVWLMATELGVGPFVV
jgi:hypothetical protein